MRTSARLTTYVASVALIASGALVAAPSASAAEPDNIAVDQGATWLEGQLDGGLLPGQFAGFADVGLSIDAALSLLGTADHGDTAGTIADAIQNRPDGLGYIEYEYPDDGKTVQGRAANATGKAMALMQSLTPKRTTIGKVDLQERLESLVATDAPITGRIQDLNRVDGDIADLPDYANTLGQAFAVRALDATGSDLADETEAFLLEQQCPAGGFRLDFEADKNAADQSCGDDDDADVDVTAIAVLQLQQLSDSTPTANARLSPAALTAVEEAQDWLRTQQKSDGSWGGGPSTEESNANSTGLASSAVGGSEGTEGAQWVRDHQASDLDACNTLRSSVGAIAYDDAGRSLGRREGVTDTSADQFRRATAQALPALALLEVPANGPLDLSGPAGYRKQGGTVGLSTSGASDGTQLCLTGVRARVRRTANADPFTLAVRLPLGTADRSYTVRDAWGNEASTTVDVLGRKTLEVRKAAYRVQRGDNVTVVIRGLAPGERARVYYRSRLVDSGTATSIGRFAASVPVGSSLGKQTVRGYGQFGDIRNGRTEIKVVR